MQLGPAGNFAKNQLCWSQLGPAAGNPSWDQLMLVPARTNCCWSQPGPTAVGCSWKCGQKPVQLVLAIVGSSPATVSDSCMVWTQCMEMSFYFKVYSLVALQLLLHRPLFGTPCVLHFSLSKFPMSQTTAAAAADCLFWSPQKEIAARKKCVIVSSIYICFKD